MSTTALYRFFDENGDLLYVGISVRPWTRWKEHNAQKNWIDEVENITLERYATRSEALAAEREAIIAEDPRYNIQHSVRRNPTVVDRLVITVLCSECGDSIGDDDGYLEVDLQAVERNIEEWADAKRGPLGVIDVATLVRLPGPEPWCAWHRSCDPAPEDEGYVIGVEDIRSLGDLLDWTAHLSEKPWYGATNWTGILRDMTGEVGPLVIEGPFLRPPLTDLPPGQGVL